MTTLANVQVTLRAQIRPEWVHLIGPFLDRAAEMNPVGWETWLALQQDVRDESSAAASA